MKTTIRFIDDIYSEVDFHVGDLVYTKATIITDYGMTETSVVRLKSTWEHIKERGYYYDVIL